MLVSFPSEGRKQKHNCHTSPRFHPIQDILSDRAVEKNRLLSYETNPWSQKSQISKRDLGNKKHIKQKRAVWKMNVLKPNMEVWTIMFLFNRVIFLGSMFIFGVSEGCRTLTAKNYRKQGTVPWTISHHFGNFWVDDFPNLPCGGIRFLQGPPEKSTFSQRYRYTGPSLRYIFVWGSLSQKGIYLSGMSPRHPHASWEGFGGPNVFSRGFWVFRA